MGQKLPLKTKKVKILGIGVNLIFLKNTLSLVEKWVKHNKQYQITTPNPEQIVLAQKNLEFKKVLNNADLAVPDGIGIVLAARFLKSKKQKAKSKNTIQNSKIRDSEYSQIYRVSGTDLMLELCKLAAKKKWRVFLLGGKGGVAKAAYKKLRITYYLPDSLQTQLRRSGHGGLRITYYKGAKDIKNEAAGERREAIKKINQFRPHILFVAYGAPWQELWIAKNLPKLKVKVAMGVGGAFDYISGRVPRAPKWLRKAGLEWLYRLAREPWRLKRQLALVKFIKLVICDRDL